MSAAPFHIDPDIRKAWTPPAAFYRDPCSHARVMEQIFARSWQFIGDLGMVKVPGQTHPLTFLEGSLDEPLVLTRDMEDRVHLVSNVCTHRGNLVCEAGGNERFLRCRYHGRRFGLDGQFQSMPGFEGVEGFPCEKDHLARVPLGNLGPFLFASLEPAYSVSDLLQPVVDRIGWMPLGQFAFEPTRTKEYLVKANWALYVENYLEGFHIPFIHQALAGALDTKNYTTELYRHCNLQLGVASDGEEAFDLPSSSPDYGRRIGAYYFWLFPNTMLNFYPWGLSVNVVRPLGHDRTKVVFIQYVWQPDKLSSGAGADLDRVEREDESIVELVQRGIRSRLYDRGRYSPEHEKGTHHFHMLMEEALRQARPS